MMTLGPAWRAETATPAGSHRPPNGQQPLDLLLNRRRRRYGERVRALHEEGHAIAEIAAAVGVSVSTVYYHRGKPPVDGAQVGQTRALLTTLGYAGPRIGETLALRHRDVRLHAAPRSTSSMPRRRRASARCTSVPSWPRPSSSTATSAVAAGMPPQTTTSSGPPTMAGRAATPGRSRRSSARRGSPAREARGLPPLPAVTPHTLRHTYISILLLVTNSVPYVMEQVGHDDETTTTRIYRHLIRQRQEHGAAFDRAVAQARAGFGGTAERQGFSASIGPGCGKNADAPGTAAL
jgi:integrase